MNAKTKDRRVRKTKKALQDGLATLMARKNIRDISVQELADLADVNRATFYLHYRDIFDLQRQIEDEVAEEINSILEQYMPGEDEEPYSLLVELLRYIQENAALAAMLLGDNSNHSFLDKLCSIIELRCVNNWLAQHRVQNTEDELGYFSCYVIYGYVAIITKWVRSGLNIPPEELADMMGRMGIDGIKFLR